jgi:putative ABC transport system permease protein
MSLALATVIYEWRRYLAAVIALAFSGLLVLAQVGMFAGIGKAFTATIDRSRADIFVLGPKAESLMNGGSGLPRRLMPLVYMNSEVAAVADMDGNGALFTNPKLNKSKPGSRKREYVQIMSIDTEPGAVTLPTDYPDATRQALQIPYSIALDKTALGRLGVKLGDTAALNGREVRVAAILQNYPNMMNPTVVMSRATLRLLKRASTGDRVGPLYVKLYDPSKAELVRDQLNAMGHGQYRAWTRPELSKANEDSMFKEQIIGIMLGFSVFLGILIGVGITSQTLRGAILANIKEFASLRALGVSMGSLRVIVIELSLWVGVVGLGATALLTAGVTMLASAGGVPMAYSSTTIVWVTVLLLLISVISGMLSLGILKKSQPADLLR